MKKIYLSALLLCGCQPAPQAPEEPQAIFPDNPVPGPFNRAYTMTESSDGMIQVWTREDGDFTKMYERRKDADGVWGTERQVPLPETKKTGYPSFSPFDGYLYYSTDIVMPYRGKGKDMNIWRVKPVESGWAEPEPLSQSLNTGAQEISPAMDGQGRLYYSSNYPRGAGGHDIYEASWNDLTSDWDIKLLPAPINDSRADSHIAVTRDGNRLFFYSHRSPKIGYVDIWTTVRDKDGNWQEPENLGQPVNTEGIDFGAGLSGDGETLFFSRDGKLMSISLEGALAGEGWTGDASDAQD